MKLTCQTELLHAAFQVVGSVVQARPTRPILGNVLLTAEDGSVEIQATDLEIGIRYRLGDAQVEKPGKVAVRYAGLHSLLSSYAKTDETIELAVEGSNCVLKTSDGRFSFPTTPAEEFPELPPFREDNARKISGESLREMVTRTTFAAHRERHRYALNGALLVVKPDTIRMVATDGRRLALVEKKAQNPEDTDIEVIVPTKALEELVKVLGDDEDAEADVLISLAGEEENQLVAKTPRAVVATRLVEGHFPPYESVIPKDHDKKAEVDPGRFLAAVQRAAVMTTDEYSSVTVHFAAERLEVTAAAPDAGEAAVSMEAAYGGPELEISFNPAFLVDFLRVVEEERVRVEFRDPTSPVLFRGGKGFLYVLMPVSRQ